MSDTAYLSYLERISSLTRMLIGEMDDKRAVSCIVEGLSNLYEEERDGELSEPAVLTSRILADLAIRLGRCGIRREKELARMEATEAELQKMHQQLLKKNMALREQTMVDELTGLFNRRYFERSLCYDLERFKRYQRPFSVVLFDVDHFKKINDTFGHGIGDESLKHLAALAKKTVRSVDLVARWGGEEFVFLLPETRRDGAVITAERFRETVERSVLDTSKGSLKMTVSLGVTSVEGDFKGDHYRIMQIVDKALYQAKESGRNQTVAAI
jgi:diguanylate cyclase (GGDEF)-like protein